MKNKQCFKCLRTLPIEGFYRHPQTGDGHLNKCKDCTRKDVEIRRQEKNKDPEWVAKEKQRMRDKENRRAHTEPEKLKARSALRFLGTSRELHRHHWSYLSEHHLDFINLTAQEHRRAHRFLVYDRERLQYRRADTMELLDTKERHESFLKTLSKKPF